MCKKVVSQKGYTEKRASSQGDQISQHHYLLCDEIHLKLKRRIRGVM